MNNKKSLICSLIIISLLFSITGCSTNEDGNLPGTNTQIKTTFFPPYNIDLSFPDGAPPLNQTAVLNCNIVNRLTSLKKGNINVILPDSFELISGSLSWNGTFSGEGIITVISAVVKSVKVGHCSINATGYIDWEPDSFGGNFDIRIYVSVNEKSAEWGISPPWFTTPSPTDTENRPPPPMTTIDESPNPTTPSTTSTETPTITVNMDI